MGVTKDRSVLIDGSQGEGGGQILRTSLALALCTQRPLVVREVRARRSRPGLLRQHLTALRAAATISKARIEGDRLGSSEVRVHPGPVRHGDHRFAVGSAGSAILVFQTVLWPLLCAPGRSRLRFEGGTHNPLAPPFDFLERAFLPVIRGMGAQIEARLVRHGFYPAGGGAFEVELEGGHRLRPLTLTERGELRQLRARALVAGLHEEIGERELLEVEDRLGDGVALGERRIEVVESAGPGNAVLIEVESAAITEVFASFGEIGRAAEAVGRAAIDEAREYLHAGVPVGRHLADQLLIPMALAGESTVTTLRPTDHTITNAAVIGAFLPAAPTVTRGPSTLATLRTGAAG
ncbi:MAG: RNA 3'-terminal phosphate cyclase [Nannocystaceae bacterium]